MELPLPKTEQPLFSVECADAVEWLRQRAPRSVDLIVTDPAYESLEEHRATGTTTRLTTDWFPIFPNKRFLDLFVAAYAALRSNAHMYVMCDPATYLVITPIAEDVGFKWWGPLVWDKLRFGMGYHYRRRYELICFFEKGHRKLNDLAVPDVLAWPMVMGAAKTYPTEKPTGLLRTLIEQSSKPGELVVDPFCGSGSTGEAALLSGRRFSGCDIAQRAVDLTRDRLSKPF